MSMNIGRREAILATVKRIHEIEDGQGTTRKLLEEVKRELLQLATHTEWFTDEDFPPPELESSDSARFYRLAEDEATHRFALYIQSVSAPLDLPPHNHDTWAVIVGIRGNELNRFYERTPEGVLQTDSCTVREGTGVAMLPDDIHSIHITDEEPVINFHMYGLGLEYLFDREYFDGHKNQWRVFPVYDNIQDARNIE